MDGELSIAWLSGFWSHELLECCATLRQKSVSETFISASFSVCKLQQLERVLLHVRKFFLLSHKWTWRSLETVEKHDNGTERQHEVVAGKSSYIKNKQTGTNFSFPTPPTLPHKTHTHKPSLKYMLLVTHTNNIYRLITILIWRIIINSINVYW